MEPRHLAVELDAQEPLRVATFWAAVLGRDVVDGPHGVLVPGPDAQLDLRLVAAHGTKRGKNHIHLHLTSTDLSDQRRTVARVLELGGSHVDVGQLPDEEHVVLGDPEGNELCVIEPGNRFLAGCGFLGELACEGSHDVGVFWSRALGWPLVWDRDEETAVQLPQGGTKVAWGGPPLPPPELRSVSGSSSPRPRPRQPRSTGWSRWAPPGAAPSPPASW